MTNTTSININNANTELRSLVFSHIKSMTGMSDHAVRKMMADKAGYFFLADGTPITSTSKTIITTTANYVCGY